MALIIHNKAFKGKKLPMSAEELINDAVNNQKTDDFILILPTGRLNRFLKYEIIEKYFRINNQPSGKINIYNLEKFSGLCFQAVSKTNRFTKISESYRLALTEEAIDNCRLEFYKSRSRKLNHHVIERLANIVYGLREDGINSKSMFDDLSKLETDETGIKDFKKFKDIAHILVEYENLLSDKYIDAPYIIKYLLRNADEYFIKNPNIDKSYFDDLINADGNIKQILVYGFSEFKMPEVEFLSKFATSEIPVSVHLDFSEINGPLFGNLAEMKSTLLTAGYNFFYTDDEIINQHINPETELNSEPKYFLKRWLFNVEKDIKYRGLSDYLNIFEFDTQEDEVKYITKLIKYLILEHKYKASDIAVVSRNTDIYSTLLRSYFSIEGVPADFSDRYDLAQSPLVISVVSILDTIAGGFKYIDVFKTLDSSFLEIKNENGSSIDKSNLIKIAAELRLSKSNYSLNAEFWIKRISSMIEFLKPKLQSGEHEIYEMDRNIIAEKIESYEKALTDFKLFSGMLPKIKNLYSPDEFKLLIEKDIIARFNFIEKINGLYHDVNNKYSDNRGYDYDIAIERIERFSKALGVLLQIVNEFCSILKDRKSKTYPLSELLSKLKTAISGAKYQTRERQNYGVSVTAVEQIRHIPYKVTILCGLNDGVFPLPYKPEQFLGKELKDSEQRHLQSEQIQFYQFLINGAEYFGSKEKKVYLTYCNKISGFESARSSFIDSLIKVTGLEKDRNIFQISPENLSRYINLHPWLKSISNRFEASSMISRIIMEARLNHVRLDMSRYSDFANISGLIDYFEKVVTKQNLTADNSFYTLNEASKEYLEKSIDRVYSTTDFDTFAGCSYKYFANKILRLKSQEDDDNIFSSMDYGNILHSILYKFYLKLQSISSENWIRPETNPNYNLPELKPVNITKHIPNDLLMLLNEIIEKEFDDIRLDHPYIQSIKREILGTDKVKGWAEIFIESEYKRLEQFLSYPVLFELEFGMGSGIPQIELPNSIRLRGKIDRIELAGDSGYNPESQETKFTTVDYKSTDNGNFTNQKIQSGRSFQMPLYSVAINKILTNYFGINTKMKGAAYYILRPKVEKGKYKNTRLVLMTNNELAGTEFFKTNLKADINPQEMLDESIRAAEDIIIKITNSEFEALPADNQVCQYCDFQTVCKIRERSIIDSSHEEISEE
ncbi:MAG: PD-(D/E)XK nuclease family protein [Candidatus Kapabacteria bacterium]|nr:PD-(D/E)XK nuclease family protein [Ignavibacteriota bacterium]MCW5884329.1 PD-(D/E)XK nuclease family protein [Candidatus Kapabacteria bacterium]